MEKRQAVEFLEYLRQDRNLERTIYGDALNIAIEALKAQLSHEGTTKDAISRQQALDAVGKYASVWMEYTDAMSKDEIAQIALNNAKSTMIRILKELPTIQPEPHWIPVERELPEDFTDVLVWFEYFRYGNYNRMCATHGIGNYSKEYNSWTINHETGWKDLHVFAWMPLPIPYQKGAIK